MRVCYLGWRLNLPLFVQVSEKLQDFGHVEHSLDLVISNADNLLLAEVLWGNITQHLSNDANLSLCLFLCQTSAKHGPGKLEKIFQESVVEVLNRDAIPSGLLRRRFCDCVSTESGLENCNRGGWRT